MSLTSIVLWSIVGQPKLPTNFEDDTWAKLKAAISAIFLKQPLSCDTEKLYQVLFSPNYLDISNCLSLFELRLDTSSKMTLSYHSVNLFVSL